MEHYEYDNLGYWALDCIMSGFTVRDDEGTLECGDLLLASVLVAEDGPVEMGRFFPNAPGELSGSGVLFQARGAYQAFLKKA